MAHFQQNRVAGLAPVQTRGPAAEPVGETMQQWERRWELRLRGAFLGMCHGLVRRPEPRHLFDNVASQRAWPWRSSCIAIRAAVAAGQSRERVAAYTEELVAFALALYPAAQAYDLRRALVDEAHADGEADPLQSVALYEEGIRGADIGTLEMLILTAQIQRQRLDDIINAARARLAGHHPRSAMGLVR